jgi:hypothetical protein
MAPHWMHIAELVDAQGSAQKKQKVAPNIVTALK